MSDSPEGLFELDPEEDDDIVTQRLRRAGKARRSARKAASAPPETEVSERGTRAPCDDDADFEIDPPDDDIFARRRRSAEGPSTGRPALAGTGRWFFVAIVVGVLAGVLLGAWLSNRDKDQPPAAATGVEAGIDMEQVAADIAELEAQLADDPTSYDAHSDLGALLHLSGDLDGAYEHLTTATELDPDRPEAWYTLGMSYYLSLDPPDTVRAQQALRKVVEVAPDSQLGQIAQNHLDRLGGGPTAPSGGESP